MIRLFTAVDIPQFPKVLEFMEAVKRTGADVKLVEPYNIHITLVFIGEIQENKLDLVKEAVARIDFQSFKIKLKGAGAFPNLSRPRVVWIGIEGGLQQLRTIRGNLLKELLARGIRPEDEKEFTPHLTIGRVKGPSNMMNLVNVINEYQNIEFGEIIVNKIILFKSTLTPKGPIYDPLLEVTSNDNRGGSSKENKT
ncbi:2'-5' RNA ligase [Sulfurisphaera tokodaii str. 7]|uniref:RNA 2',3'-cyclic phosphodiesterase n=1 Tax=Sulfurisphaera tokodaii (strain DSM 16993 / JCM 10545 / NBRC 100140 / 7) TaxID=273063 RepID=F9VNR3_SULTO|nr:RNA 2',3'-cyclic phosphodiesterase [Sulfurisphaera tokodaii]BAK54421.1 2'-5' RNA ligase [Sulfurisphaera tokodaii str. 7]